MLKKDLQMAQLRRLQVFFTRSCVKQNLHISSWAYDFFCCFPYSSSKEAFVLLAVVMLPQEVENSCQDDDGCTEYAVHGCIADVASKDAQKACCQANADVQGPEICGGSHAASLNGSTLHRHGLKRRAENTEAASQKHRCQEKSSKVWSQSQKEHSDGKKYKSWIYARIHTPFVENISHQGTGHYDNRCKHSEEKTCLRLEPHAFGVNWYQH